LRLSDLAKALNLSTTTVSRALAGYSDVSPTTRARVEAAARRLGYKPNPVARSLRTGRAGAVGVALPTDPGRFDDPFFLQFLAAMGRKFAAAEIDLLVTAARPGEEEIKVYRRLIDHRRVDGIVIARTRRHDPRIEFLQSRGFPFVAHGRTETDKPYAHVDVDGVAAFEAATRRLAAFGHRNIALVNAPDIYMFAHFREEGWRRALDQLGLPLGPIRAAEPTEENGHRLTRELLASPDRPTAFLCATDRLAVGALHAIAAAGLRAGRDVSVIGYDDLPMATYTDPPLTTIRQPLAEAGDRTVDILIELMAGADPAAYAELLEARLVARASDGPLVSSTAAPTQNLQIGGTDNEVAESR
jgi:LacI family transcriptional regulator